MEQSQTISASELEKFGYCPLSWWLSKEEEQRNQELAEGEKKHARISKSLKHILRHEKRARESEVIVLYFAIAATIASLLALAFVFRTQLDIGQILGVISLIWLLSACYFLYRAETIATETERLLAERIVLIFAMVASVIAVFMLFFTLVEDQLLGQIFGAIALVWLIGATYFLYHSLRFLELAIIERTKHGVGEDEIMYVDELDRRPKMFFSSRFGLKGRPDYVVLVGDDHIPVEVKTGRVPRGPLFSHILQTAAYCLLIEEEYGRAPPFGLLRYETNQHEIDYTPDMRKLILEKLIEMREILDTRNVHRNHNRKGKCTNCSRRKKCPERLA
ncbi:MAG: PD-(D/E)XK nuclease family protein [Methanobacteriota archaeon]|nr:MAG: PD-(D/E)XK nuclease family protein [Euryarchaeota archaeon]